MKSDGASAIVTGGASGLGLATVARLLADGFAPVIVDLPSSDGQAHADRLGIRFAAADVTDAQQVSRAVKRAAELGPVRVLVNCAGIGTPGRVFGARGVHPLELFEQVVAVNLTGTFNAIRLAARAIADSEPIDGERGVIVNTSSVAAFDGQVGQAAYSASKGAVAAMTLPLARDLAEHLIRVVTLAPGMFLTPLLSGLPAAAVASLGRQVPHPARVGDPSEYAALVSHVVSNPMINGEVIRIDGALRMSAR